MAGFAHRRERRTLGRCQGLPQSGDIAWRDKVLRRQDVDCAAHSSRYDLQPRGERLEHACGHAFSEARVDEHVCCAERCVHSSLVLLAYETRFDA